MEQRRIDPLQIIGMVLVFVIFTWMMYNQSAEDLAQTNTQETQTTEAVAEAKNPTAEQIVATPVEMLSSEETAQETITIQNDELTLGLSTNGGAMGHVLVKG